MSYLKPPLSKPKFFTIFILLATLAATLPLSALAQDPEADTQQTFVSHDGSFSFQYPVDWSLTLEDELILLSNGDPEESVFFNAEAEGSVAVVIVPPSQFGELFPNVEDLPRTPRELLELLILDATDTDIFSDIEEGTLNGHRAVFANVDDNELSGQLFVLDLDDGDLVLILAAAISGDYAQHQEVVLSIVASLTLHRYLPGDFRTVTSPAMNITFEMPAEYIYDDMDEDGAVFFGSNQEVIDSALPNEGEFLGLFASEVFLTEALGLEAESFESPEQALTVFSDSVVGAELEGVTFSEMEHLSFDNAPVSEIVQFTFTSEMADGVIMAFELPDGRIIVAAFIASSGELSDYEDIISQIATSIKAMNVASSADEPDVEADTDSITDTDS